jgi:hypothetical protein
LGGLQLEITLGKKEKNPIIKNLSKYPVQSPHRKSKRNFFSYAWLNKEKDLSVVI